MKQCAQIQTAYLDNRKKRNDNLGSSASISISLSDCELEELRDEVQNNHQGKEEIHNNKKINFDVEVKQLEFLDLSSEDEGQLEDDTFSRSEGSEQNTISD